VFCFTSAGLKTGATIGVARDFNDVGRLSAQLVDRVLRGENVANIPFANPTRTLVLVNPDRMQRFGLALPRSILDSAKEVRE
jgi:putative ABC transport system substrate-binding protein